MERDNDIAKKIDLNDQLDDDELLDGVGGVLPLYGCAAECSGTCPLDSTYLSQANDFIAEENLNGGNCAC